MAVASLADRLRAQIHEHGPIPVSEFVAAALYDQHEGFYVTGGRAGRRGDFLTAPEVGPLFGAVISRAVDSWWREAGGPGTFTVVEHGAGPGTLARTVTAAAGECLAAGALRWVMVEVSATQREAQPVGDHLTSVGDETELGSGPVDVVLANELLDNLPFDMVAARVESAGVAQVGLVDESFVLVGDGDLLPNAAAAVEWVRAQRANRPEARLVVLDYMASDDDLRSRGGEWLRAYRDHERVADWLAAPGQTDITIDVPLDQLLPLAPSWVRTQAEFLAAHGIHELVEEGRAIWAENAAIGDLAALKARSRVREVEALLDPTGLGAFVVLEWEPARP